MAYKRSGVRIPHGPPHIWGFIMQTVILAAGEGIRMRPLTLAKPKPLIEVLGKPLIKWIVESLPPEVDELVIVVSYLGQQIINYCSKEFCGKKVSYVWQEKKLGTADALLRARPLIKKGRFYMFYADDILDAESITAALRHDLCLMVTEAEHPEKFGVVELNTDGSIKQIVEKPEHPASNLVSAAGMVLDERIFNYKPVLSQSGEYYLTSMIDQMLKDYKIYTQKIKVWIPVGRPEDIKIAETTLKEKGY